MTLSCVLQTIVLQECVLKFFLKEIDKIKPVLSFTNRYFQDIAGLS